MRYTCFPWSIALSTGPSYALNPPREQFFHGKALLNYVGAEFAYAIPHSAGWDVSVRFYHRSGRTLRTLTELLEAEAYH